MPRDSNGVMTLPASTWVQTGDTVLPVQHNPPFRDIENALTNSVARDGRAVWTGDMQAGGYRVTGAGQPSSAGDLMRLQDATVATRTALKALNTNAFTNIYLTEEGREGQFIWREGDQSSLIDADPFGLYSQLANGVDKTQGAWLSATGTPTPGHWIDIHPELRVHRLNDRVFVGGATRNDGKFVNDQADWLTTAMQTGRPGFVTTNNMQMAVFSTIGQIAFGAASRTSDIARPGMGCIAVSAFVDNDNITNPGSAYAFYGEAWRQDGAGTAHFLEGDIINMGSLVTVQPYNMFTDGLTAHTWVASGGEVVGSQTSSVGIAIVNNGSNFEKGIVFAAESLVGSDGISGSAIAIELAKGHGIRQLFGSGSLGATIGFDVSNSLAEQRLIFGDIGLLLRNGADKNLLRVAVRSDYVNGIVITPGGTGVSPEITVAGDDTNIDLRLDAKGAGVVDIRNPEVQGAAGPQGGFFVIKLDGVKFAIPYHELS